MDQRNFSGKQIGRFLLSSPLGSGGAGTVYLAVDTTTAESSALAIKCVPKGSTAVRLRQQIAEVDNHSAVARCPNVVKLYDVFEAEGHFFLTMALCELDLFRAIWKEKLFWRDDGLLKKASVEIIDGISACHRKGIFHRDLKPENIMCSATGTNIEIGDFGLSIDRRVCRDGRCGTSTYMSPECWDNDGIFYYAKPLDIWSLGVVLFNMVTCRYPWGEARGTDADYVAFRSNKSHLLYHYPISTSFNALLHQIWHPTPMRRMSLSDIRRVILEMDTFYGLPHSLTTGLLSPAGDVVDSQQTCVATVEEDKKKGGSIPDALETVPL